jgi:hypothetical protein
MDLLLIIKGRKNPVCQSIEKLAEYENVAVKNNNCTILLYLYVFLNTATAETVSDIIPTDPKQNTATVVRMPTGNPTEKKAR